MRNPFAIPAPGSGLIPDTIVWAFIWPVMLLIVIGGCYEWMGK
jgi:hypothetical protein